MVFLTGLIGFAVALYSLGSMDAGRESFGYYPLLQILMMGICGALLTGAPFNLYVWFEVMLTASFVLLALGGGAPSVGRRSQVRDYQSGLFGPVAVGYCDPLWLHGDTEYG